jgi:hypothetical protein
MILPEENAVFFRFNVMHSKLEHKLTRVKYCCVRASNQISPQDMAQVSKVVRRRTGSSRKGDLSSLVFSVWLDFC